MTFPAEQVAWRGWGFGVGLILASHGWLGSEDISTSPSPSPSPLLAPTESRSIVTHRSGGGGGSGSASLIPPKVYAHFPDPEESIESDSDYALMVIAGNATVRALASGRVTHFRDARGRSALKLEADNGTNYYYADLSGYVGVTDRRVEVGEAIAKSAREPVPEITRTPRTKILSATTSGMAEPSRLRTIAPVFVEPPAEPITVALPPRMWVKLIPLPAPPIALSDEWATVRAPDRPRSVTVAYVAGVGALVAFLCALSFAPKLWRPKRE